MNATGAAARIRVTKAASGSNLATFYLTNPPVIASLSPAAGSWGSVITINGAALNSTFTPDTVQGKAGCYAAPNDGPLDCYYTYVELHASNDDYRVIPSKFTVVDFQTISATLNGMLDVRTGNPVPNAQEFYPGNWQVDVVTDYFTDDTLAGAAGYLKADGSIDTAKYTLKYRKRSEARTFNVTYSPVINSILPNPVKSLNTMTIYGVNFGTLGPEVLLDSGAAKGDDDGRCEYGERCKIKYWNKKELKFKYAIVYSWGNTVISLQAPKYIGAKSVIKKVQIETTGGALSNKYPITVVP
jgi:hypothetical protein